MSTPFSDSERKAMTALMREVYDQFLDRVVDNRTKNGVNLTKERLEKELAGGRVWTGRQAKELGLVDELGTMSDAVAAAWHAAGQKPDTEPELLLLPKPRSARTAHGIARGDGVVADGVEAGAGHRAEARSRRNSAAARRAGVGHPAAPNHDPLTPAG
jgi:protease-4